jgi:hypothetical protein
MCNVDPNTTTLSLARLHQADLTASFSRRRRNFRHDPSLPTHDFSVRKGALTVPAPRQPHPGATGA